MKSYLWLMVLILISVSSCQKSVETEEDQFPSGKWESIAFGTDEGNWTNDPMPHHWDFTSDKGTHSFSFRDHNGAECRGEFTLVTPINSYTQLDFLNQNCGFTSREIESYVQDTLVLRVINPPNITKDRVKYIRKQ